MFYASVRDMSRTRHSAVNSPPTFANLQTTMMNSIKLNFINEELFVSSFRKGAAIFMPEGIDTKIEYDYNVLMKCS